MAVYADVSCACWQCYMWVLLKAVPSGAICIGGCLSVLHPLSLSMFVLLAYALRLTMG